jgi:hypothetical protein
MIKLIFITFFRICIVCKFLSGKYPRYHYAWSSEIASGEYSRNAWHCKPL